MKRTTFLFIAIGLFLAILSSSADAQDEDNIYDDDLWVPEQADLDTPGNDLTDKDYGEDDEYVLLDDEFFSDDAGKDYDDHADNTLDIRSVNLDDLLSQSDDVLLDDLEKRSWMYKCEPTECNERCLRLLKLPKGECGFKGKCYCKRVI